VADDDHREAAHRADLRGEDQESKADGEMRHDQRRKQQRLDQVAAEKSVAIEREGKRGSDKERDAGGRQHDDQPIVESGLEITIAECLDEPAQRPALRRE
jgi:hypothetical protein